MFDAGLCDFALAIVACRLQPVVYEVFRLAKWLQTGFKDTLVDYGSWTAVDCILQTADLPRCRLCNFAPLQCPCHTNTKHICEITFRRFCDKVH